MGAQHRCRVLLRRSRGQSPRGVRRKVTLHAGEGREPGRGRLRRLGNGRSRFSPELPQGTQPWGGGPPCAFSRETSPPRRGRDRCAVPRQGAGVATRHSSPRDARGGSGSEAPVYRVSVTGPGPRPAHACLSSPARAPPLLTESCANRRQLGPFDAPRSFPRLRGIGSLQSSVPA